jgi:hypothetical protein
MKRILVVGVVLGAVATAACGTGDVATITQNGRPPSALPVRPRAERPIDWHHPLAASVKSSRGQARAQGRLSFSPIVPTWAVSESAVYVSDASRIPVEHAAVAFVYEFPTGEDFPTNGHVVMVQRRTDETEDSFAEIAQSNGTEHFTVIEIRGRPALLVEANGIGRVRVIRNGVLVDITGPETPPAAVVKLAAGLG